MFPSPVPNQSHSDQWINVYRVNDLPEPIFNTLPACVLLHIFLQLGTQGMNLSPRTHVYNKWNYFLINFNLKSSFQQGLET